MTSAFAGLKRGILQRTVGGDGAELQGNAPTAKTLTYNGSVQTLVNEGIANGGTMQYALGNETEATEPYTTSIPTGINAGTYYVWYMVKGDENHDHSETASVAVNVAEVKYYKEVPLRPQEK